MSERALTKTKTKTRIRATTKLTLFSILWLARLPHDPLKKCASLRSAQNETLIITGMGDVITPAYHSYEMASMIPYAELWVANWGTHFVLLEYPQQISEAILKFLERGSEEMIAEKKLERLELEEKAAKEKEREKEIEDKEEREKARRNCLPAAGTRIR